MIFHGITFVLKAHLESTRMITEQVHIKPQFALFPTYLELLKELTFNH